MKRLALFLMILVACDRPKDAVKGLTFFKDPRSGLCFAAGTYQWVDQVSSVFTWVPCEKIPPALLVEAR